jgi:hypothetical protein
MKNSAFLFIIVFILSLVLNANSQSIWQADDISATDKREVQPDVAVQPDGTAHFVFVKETGKIKGNVGHDIFYANTQGNVLSVPQQLTNLCTSVALPTIALDAGGHVHVIFEKPCSRALAYLNNVGGSFSTPIEMTFGTISVPREFDLDIDATGNAHIVYFGAVDGVWHIFYATNSSGSFEVIDLGNFGFDKGALFPTVEEKDGIVHIAFKGAFSTETVSFYQNIYYINNFGGSFPTANPTLVVDNSPYNQNPTISVDNAGTVHIVHDISRVLGIQYSQNSSGVFQTESVLAPGFAGNAHALGPENEIGIVSNTDGPTLDDMVYTTNKTGAWITEPITAAESGTRRSEGQRGIAIDGSGYVHVVGTINRINGRKDNFDVRYFTTNPNFIPGGDTGGGLMHIAAIDVNTRAKGKNVNGVATVTVVDENNNPVEGATVSGAWSGLTTDSDNLLTGPDGTDSANSNKVNKSSSGNFTFTVTDISKSGWTYDANANVENSDSAPWNLLGKGMATNSKSSVQRCQDSCKIIPILLIHKQKYNSRFQSKPRFC